MKIKNILIISDTHEGQRNGVSTTLYSLKRCLEKTKLCNVRIIDNSFFPCLPIFFYRELALAITSSKNLLKIIQSSKFDAIHIMTEGPLGFLARKLCHQNQWRYTTHYCTQFPELINFYTHIPIKLLSLYFYFFHKKSVRTFVPSRGMARVFSKKNPHIVFVPIGVPVLKPPKKLVKINPYKDLKSPILLCVGRISKEKGIEDFCKLSTKGSKVIVGDGPILLDLQKKYRDVIFFGSVPHSDIHQYYLNADVLVFPSKFDSFGRVIIEANACGLPVAGYSSSFGMQDVIKNEKNGFHSTNLQKAVGQALKCKRSNVTLPAQYDEKQCAEEFYNNLSEI